MMRVTSLRGSHWMAIGLLGGLLCGAVRSASMNFADELAQYGDVRLGQRDFELALVAKYRGRPGFDRLVIYPYRLSGASTDQVNVHVVSGMYCDGQEHEENGRLAYQWRSVYFVASVPYQPVGAAAEEKGRAANRPALFPNVMAFLDSRKTAGAAPYRYAGWWWAARPPFMWACGVFVIVGLIWPVVINLLACGQFSRPKEPKGVLLANVKAPAPAAAAAPADPDLQLVRELDGELEVKLSETEAPPAADVAAELPARGLAGGPLEVEPVASGPAKEFGAKREDFYPTELGAKHET